MYAANITVDSVADDNVTNDGICTLREAIAAANTDLAVDSCTQGAGADTITFDNSLSGSTVTLANGQLGITSDLSIDGDLDNDGTPDIEINAGGTSRVIDIYPASANIAVALEGLTISNGNTSGSGGGVNNRYVYVYKYGPVFSNLTISNSVISGNTAQGSGGGVSSEGYETVTINNSSITSNTATNGAGGGIYTKYSVSLTDSTISDNIAGASGGGIFSSDGTTNITNSTVSGNTATNTGGGIYGGGGTVTMTNSTVSGNNSSDTGGGISIDNGTVAMTNSTLSGNTATNTGGGIYNYSGYISMTNSTISNNSAGTSGGGVYFKDLNGFATLDIFNSILANNTNADCASNTLTVTGNNNLVEDEGSCNIAANTTSLLTADPLLGTLADNGGPTQTHLPMVGSPVLDAGDNTNCGPSLTVATDQRGVARDDGSCDIGAVEGTVSTAPSVSVQFDSSTATVSEDGTSITLNLTRSGDTVSAISVDYTTGDGTATAPADYTANMNTLNFATGVTSQSVTIDISDDTDVEGDEDFSVTLSNVLLVTGSAQVALGTNASSTVTITDNDAAADTGTTPASTGSSSGALGLSPWWMLLGFTAWLRRKFKS